MENREQKIRERAHKIYEFRQQHGMMCTMDRLGNVRDITAQDDWLEAEEEIIHADNFPGRFRRLGKESEG